MVYLPKLNSYLVILILGFGCQTLDATTDVLEIGGNILLGMNWLEADNSEMTKEMLTKMKLKAMKVTILQETYMKLWEIL